MDFLSTNITHIFWKQNCGSDGFTETETTDSHGQIGGWVLWEPAQNHVRTSRPLRSAPSCPLRSNAIGKRKNMEKPLEKIMEALVWNESVVEMIKILQTYSLQHFSKNTEGNTVSFLSYNPRFWRGASNSQVRDCNILCKHWTSRLTAGDGRDGPFLPIHMSFFFHDPWCHFPSRFRFKGPTSYRSLLAAPHHLMQQAQLWKARTNSVQRNLVWLIWYCKFSEAKNTDIVSLCISLVINGVFDETALPQGCVTPHLSNTWTLRAEHLQWHPAFRKS